MAGENGSSAHGTVPPEQQQQQATGIQKIVWLRQMLRGWQSTAARRSGGDQLQDDGGEHRVEDKETAAGRHVVDGGDKKTLLAPTPAESSDPRRPRMVEEKEADFLVDVPRGCCAVYVGAERRRFVVPTAYLGMQVFRRLLEKAEEEFEFDYKDGALTIPCDTEDFKYILVVMDRHKKGLVDDEGNPKEEEEDDL